MQNKFGILGDEANGCLVLMLTHLQVSIHRPAGLRRGRSSKRFRLGPCGIRRVGLRPSSAKVQASGYLHAYMMAETSGGSRIEVLREILIAIPTIGLRPAACMTDSAAFGLE